MATIIGISPQTLVLNSTSFRREIIGLERISDVYTAKTEDASFFQEIIKNGASHKTITGYVRPIPSANQRFQNVLVENVETSNEPGELTIFNVTYVGQSRDILPKPIVSLQPIDNYAFNPFSITINFVEYIGDVGSFDEINFLRKYQRLNNLPAKINGYPTPQSSVAPFSGEITSKILPIISASKFFSNAIDEYSTLITLGQTSTRQDFQLFRIQTSKGNIILDFTRRSPIVTFRGLCISGLSYERYGKYAHAIVTASDSAYYSFLTVDEEPQLIEESLNFN